MISLKKRETTHSKCRNCWHWSRISSFQPWFLYIKWLFTKTSAVQKLCAWVKRASKRKTNTSNHSSNTIYLLTVQNKSKIEPRKGICVKKHVQIRFEWEHIHPTHCYILNAVYITLDYITLAVFLSKWKAFSQEDRRICIKSTSFPHRRGHTLSLLRKINISAQTKLLKYGARIRSACFPPTQTLPLMLDVKIAFSLHRLCHKHLQMYICFILFYSSLKK